MEGQPTKRRKADMAALDSLQDLKNLLDSCGQSHIYQSLDNFNMDHPIAKQLQEIDILRSVEHFREANAGVQKRYESEFQPISNVINVTTVDPLEKEQYIRTGREAIARGKVAAIIMSGGQGTRLNYNGPKGMYDLGMPSHKSIFQLHIEKILKMQQLSNAMLGDQTGHIPIYIMTSNMNHTTIIQFFVKHDYFGYPSGDIVFFQQGVEPSFTFDGKVIIESDHSLSLAPDGNGGIYRALLYSGCIDDMKSRGVEHLHIYGIDNVLTKSLDPLFIGACIQNGSECGNKVVWRAHKAEKVGVTAEQNKRMHILEYSELPADLADSTDENGKLLFGAANICNHYLSVTFLVDTVIPSLSDVYHMAEKKIPYYDCESHSTITPTKNNGIKLEMFVFDVFPLASKWTVVETLREDEFAPVKNAPGSAQDSPDTARLLLSEQAKRWLTNAGAQLISDQQTPTTEYCEVSALLSYEGEGLEKFSGQTIKLPCYLS